MNDEKAKSLLWVWTQRNIWKYNRKSRNCSKKSRQGCELFYTGAMGEFDELFSSAVRILKKTYPEIKLICVRPYLTKEINESEKYLYSLYDDIIIPTELADIHYKTVITKRNQWIIDKCDVVIGYTIRDYGGAYKAIDYAKKKGKEIIIE